MAFVSHRAAARSLHRPHPHLVLYVQLMQALRAMNCTALRLYVQWTQAWWAACRFPNPTDFVICRAWTAHMLPAEDAASSESPPLGARDGRCARRDSRLATSLDLSMSHLHPRLHVKHVLRQDSIRWDDWAACPQPIQKATSCNSPVCTGLPVPSQHTRSVCQPKAGRSP